MAKNAITSGMKKTFLISLCTLSLISLPSGILLLVGMLPTLTVWQYDHLQNKNVALTIGFMNLAGIIPFIIEVFPHGQQMQHVMETLRSTKTWGIIYLGAFMGWMILQGLHPLIKRNLTAQITSRQAKFKKMQEQLVEKWGEDVTNPKKQHLP